MSILRIKDGRGNLIDIPTHAIETPILDLSEYYDSENVEGALREIGQKIHNGVATPQEIEALIKQLDLIQNNVKEVVRQEVGKLDFSNIIDLDTETLNEIIKAYKEGSLGGGSGSIDEEKFYELLNSQLNVKVLKEMTTKYLNGGLSGGGSAVSPTIESLFPSETIIEEGTRLDIDVFFQTPNLGEGIGYITINGVEIDYYPTLEQGDNIIKIDSKYLTKTSNIVSIYVKDRTGMTSNKLNFKVVAGGVRLTTTFDYTIDYVVGQNILFPFNVETEILGTITLEMVIDGIKQEPIICVNGYNSLYFNEYITNVGVHAVSMQLFVGDYHSKVLNFNIVISSSTQLMVSTTLLEGTTFEHGNPIQMPYRISKLGSEIFTVEFYIDEILVRTATAPTGNYYWTISGTEMRIGVHKLDIVVIGMEGDKASISVNIEILEGEFVPVLPVEQGIVCWLDSDGYSNEQKDRTTWIDKSGHGNDAELIGFNFATNGWSPIVAEVDNEGNEVTVKYNGLVCNNDAYVRIPYKPFRENIINGYTMEIVYTPEHSGNDLARVLEYVDHESPYTGVFIDINEANIKSETETSMGTVDLDYESGEIQIDFVVDRENKMCRMYINGIVSRYWMLSDSGMNRESFAIDTDYIYINFSGLSEEYCGGTNIVRKFICYERALSHDEVIQNLIANQPDLPSMQQMYKWNYETQIPKLYIYGDISQCSSTNPSYVRVKFESPDTAKYGESFDMESLNTPFYLQGTSSLGYTRKNYRMVLYDSNGKEFFHKLHPDVMAESTFTLKCDYVDSSMCSNVCLSQIANDCVYGKGFTPAQKDNMERRTAIYGHAIEVINVVDNKSESLGAYMFNIDRYATKNLGYDTKQYPNMLCIEGESNSDVGSSAFFSYSNPQSSGNQFPNEIAYHNEGWRVVYPSINEASYDFGAVKRLVDFVSDSSDDDFKDSFEQYFNKESVLKYYLFDMFIGGIDGLSKNFHLCSWDGLVYYVLPYDLDSCLGGTNTGYLRVPPSCEVGTLYDNDGVTVLEENHFNSWNSQLWRRVRNTFSVDLENMYRTLRSNGLFTLENMLTYFDAVTDIISPKMYNDSQQIKYISDGAVGTVALHGNRKLQIRKWLRERIAYLDSKYSYYAGGGVGESYCNFRMNYQGAVSLDLTTYYTVYAKVRWATNNEQTIRIARGQKKTFSYYSDVGTDREVMIFLPESLKTIENISRIYPNSIDVSKATKLTKIEAHNPNLFSVDLSKNKYLRKIDFNGCARLGTETATMTLNFCKYLNEVDLRGTQITGVNFNTKGGSLRRIYYPESIQSVVLLNQFLLTDMILPYGNDGENIPIGLATITIENCPQIKKIIDLNNNPMSLQGMKYCRNMTLNNSIMLEKFNFNGFTRLSNVNLQNMETLKEIDFLNMTKIGEETTLKYIGISACPNLKRISMNCDDPNYEIRWATKSLLDLQTAGAVEEISSNCVIKGLETIVLPRSIKSLYFTNEYGEGYSDIKNIWSAESCTVIKTAVYPEAQHLNSANEVNDYVGIDFRGLHLLNIDLGALVNIPDAINFSLYPTHVNPNFNLNRDGVDIPFLQPKGILDLSNYTESLAKFFNGVDLDKLYVISQNDLPQTDFSYCFYGSFFENSDSLKGVLNHAKTISNMEYCFYKTSIDSTEILNNINMKPGTSLAYAFGYCENITELNNVTISALAESVEGMFQGSNLTTVNNFTVLCENIKALFKDCPKLMSVNNFKAENTTSYESLFEGDIRLAIPPIKEIPEYVTNINNMYKNCSNMISIDGMVFHANLTDYEGFIEGCSNLINANNITIKGNYFSDFFKSWTSVKYMNNLLTTYVGRSMSFNNMFEGMVNLMEFSFHDDSYVKDVVSMDYMCKGTNISKIDLTNVNFERLGSAKYLLAESNMRKIEFHLPTTITNITGLLSNCPNLEEIYNVTFSHYITRATDWLLNSPLKILRNCTIDSNLVSFANCNTLEVIDNLLWKHQDFGGKFTGCTSLKTATVNFADTVTSLGRAVGGFENCPSLTFVDFLESTLPNLATFNRLFNGDTSLTTINNFRISNTTATCGNQVLTGCPISNTDGLIINSQTALEMFKLGSESKITAITDFELGLNVKNLSNLFKEYQLITHDIVIPNHVENVSSMYQNCLGLTHVTSNWINNYNIGEINSENCYAGCTNISHIDNELYMNEYGELTAIYNIPEEWGGILDLDSYANVFEIFIENEENLTVSFEGLEGDQLTEWGDLSISRSTTHTYPAPGRYIVKTNLINPLGLGKGTSIDSTLASLVTKIYKLTDTEFTSASYLFKGFSNLKELCKLTLNLPNPTHMFEGCVKIPDIDVSDCIFTGTDFSYMFLDCIIPTIKFTIPDTAKNIDYIFGGCNNLIDISGTVFGSGITSATNWNPPNLKYANNVIDKSSLKPFKGNVTVQYTKNISRPNSTNWDNYFEGCVSLKEDIIFPNNTTSVISCYKNCEKITHIHSNWDNSYNSTIIHTDCYVGCIGITHIDEENIISYNGDLGLDYVPIDWGGNGFTLDCTTIYELNITDEFLNKPLKPSGVKSLFTVGESIAKVNWGDGSPAELLYANGSLTTHNYTTKGTYFVKAHVTMGYGYGVGFGGAISKILQVSKYRNGSIFSHFDYACSNASNMTYADFSNIAYEKGVTKFKVGAMFSNCNKLTTVILPSDLIVEKCDSIFNQCHSLESIDFIKDWTFTNIADTSSMFSGCRSVRDFSCITNIDFSLVTNAREMFKDCWLLNNIDFLNNCNFDSLNNVEGFFQNCTSLINVTLPDWFKNPTITNVGSLFYGCTNLKEIHNFDWNGHFNLSGFTGVYPYSVINGCSALTTIEDINMDYTSILGTQHQGNAINSDYWVICAWNIFGDLNNLQNINFTGTVTLYETRKDLRFFLNCDVSKFTLETWQSFVDTLPVTTGSYTIRINKGLATIPDSIVSQITNKGYSLTA